MTVLIDNGQDFIPWGGEAQARLERAVMAALELAGGPANAQVSLMLTDDAGIRELNRTYRGQDRSTDVLSFPMLDDPRGALRGSAYETDPETGEVMLGDIAISLETAARQAALYGHGFDREIGFLAVHGLLHLLGYGHEAQEDRLVMRAREEEIMAALGLGRDGS